MKRLSAFLVLAVGLCLAITGAWWVWTGLGIVVTERGWSSVIAGATMLSAGLVIATMSAVLRRLDAIAASLRAGVPEPRQPREPSPTTEPAPAVEPAAAVARRPDPPPRPGSTPRPDLRARPDWKPRPDPEPRPPDAERSPDKGAVASPTRDSEAAPGGRETIGRHVSGDTTYVMFADGSVEAHTPEGIVVFKSLDALRAHTEEREAAGQGGVRPARRP